jgi:hypothetical protein
VSTVQQFCLYCDAPADSLEHFLPSGLGGMLRLPILCSSHNQQVAKLCDDPLCDQMALFVNALRVVKYRGEGGVPITGKTSDGDAYTIDREQRPQPAMKILERDASGRPTKAQAPTIKAAEKLLKSMGLSQHDPGISINEERVTGLTIEFNPAFGGSDGLRGVLKIAYEYVRGVLGSAVLNSEADADTRRAIIGEDNPNTFVRWLPYEWLPADEVPFYSHRLGAWQAEENVLVLIEFFNTLPFVARLPGLELSKPQYYVQGIKGEDPLRGEMRAAPQWTWGDVPENALPIMFAGVEERIGHILRTRQAMEYLQVAAELFGRALQECTASATDAQILERARCQLTGWGLSDEKFKTLDAVLVALLADFRANTEPSTSQEGP